jgi:O-antigen/teichoic acid export membrane protein
MSTVADVIRPSLSHETPPQPPEEPKGLLRGFGKNIWALNDQILISGTNFATTVLTARSLNDREFGAFSVIYGVLLLCNIVQSTLITHAHNVLGAIRMGRDYRRFTGSTAVQQLIIVAIEAILVVPIAVAGYFAGWTSTAMLVALIPSIVAWQLQEFVRRVLYTEGRYADAFLNDVISYGGQTVVIAGLFASQLYGGKPFTGAMALYALAGTSAVAALLGVWQLRHSVERAPVKESVRESWQFGKWLLGGELLGWTSSIHMQVWWAAIIIGTVASADLKAAQILFGPTRVVTYFLATVLPIRFARTLHRDGTAGLRRSVHSAYLILVPTVGAYCLLLAIFPKPLLYVVYGAKYATDAARVLQLYALAAFQRDFPMCLTPAVEARRPIV